ncbi:hypothetical protein SPONL_1564 [uncultured Candidatus Thioglobus sp.]|nr:hypothetical protein SPONL_1564 [uncultured Candidatus Thioglobus sp.]
MFVFTKQAHKQFSKLEKRIQGQIIGKLRLLKQDEKMLIQNIKSVINMHPITHRVRIGSYRLLLSFDGEQQYKIIKVAHRKDVYRKFL